MRFAGLMLRDFVPVKDSGIYEVDVTFTEDVQVLIGSNGSGKAQPLDSLIRTPSGWSRLGDATLDSKVVTPDGGTASIIGIYPQGEKDIYRITFEDGRTAECCDDHLWRIYSVFWGKSNKKTGIDTTENRWRVIPFRDIRINMEAYNYKAGWFVELPEPEVRKDAELFIDPYVLGVILGDGHIADTGVTITTYDSFVADEVAKNLPKDFELIQRKNAPVNFGIIKSTRYKRYEHSSFMDELRALGLADARSNSKFIPDVYMNASASQKLALIQGLMDTDGHIGKIGSSSFCTVSPKLAIQFQEIIRSLGGLCKITEKKTSYTYKEEKKQGQLAYNLNVRVKNPECLFRLPRKKERCPTDYQYKDRLRLRIRNIEYIGKKEAQCIMIDHPSHLYITNDYVVTHNTQFLRQLSPTPTPRSFFEKNGKGYKTLVVEDNGVYYKMESDYEKPSSPHLFYEGDNEDNLNIGRTTDTQKELIAEHLGVTPIVDDLIMNRYVFPKWTPSKRKEFLMGANPVQVGFVLAHIKQIASKVKACKNNLARLQSRKIQLEQDLLDEESLEKITQEKHQISEDLGNFQQHLMDIEVGLRSLQSPHSTLTLHDLPGIRKTVKRAHYQLSNLSHITRDDKQRQTDRETTLSKIAVCTQRLEEIDEEIIQTSTNLLELETRYREFAVEGDLLSIDATIERLEGERDKLHVPRPAFELTHEELEVKYRELDILISKLQVFSNLSVTLLPMKRRQHRERMLSSSQYKQSSYRQRLTDLESRYASLSERHQLKPRDIPDSPCAKDRCPLYSHFMGEYTHFEEQRTSVQKAIDKGIRKTARLDRFVEGLASYLNNSQPYVDQIQWLVGYAQSNPILHHLLRQIDILSVLSTQPNQIGRSLQNAYDQIAQWIKLKAIMADLETAYALKSRQISSESHDTIKLVSSIDAAKKSLYELRNATKSITDNKRRLSKLLDDISTFSFIKETVLTIQHQHQQMMESLAQGFEKDRLLILKRGVEELRARHFIRMSTIETTIRAQSSLKERYQEEVLSQIGIIEKELVDQQKIEAALIAIPNDCMIDFINDVFTQANLLIESIWTIPLKIELLNYTDPLNYEFYVSGDNESLREMSECSDGQTEVLSLAINLALRIILKHMNFPLCLDESGKTFDPKHQRNLIFLLKKLLDDKIISQLFLISHHVLIHENFINAETLVLREENVILPEEYNKHATIK